MDRDREDFFTRSMRELIELNTNTLANSGGSLNTLHVAEAVAIEYRKLQDENTALRFFF